MRSQKLPTSDGHVLIDDIQRQLLDVCFNDFHPVVGQLLPVFFTFGQEVVGGENTMQFLSIRCVLRGNLFEQRIPQ